MRSILVMAGVACAAPALAQLTLYESDNFRGTTFTAQRSTDNLERYGFNDRASSAVVILDRWEVCEDAHFGGKCVVLRPGQYASLAGLGMNNKISSVRMIASNARVEDNRYAPEPVVDSPYRRRGDEKLYEANVTSVHAVVGPPEQRCWVEHQQVAPDRNGPNVTGAVAGALIGGILGHQVGNGRGNDLATAGGAVAGAVVGSNVGRDSGGQPGYGQDVQRCSTAPSQARPDYWDVTYDFRGRQHRMQVTNPPGRTVTVNEQGEPRA